MPQPQPHTPDVMRIIGICLTLIGVISVLLFFLGLACKMANIVIDHRMLTARQHFVLEVASSILLMIGWIGVLFAFLIKGLLRVMVSESKRVFRSK